MQVYLRLLLSRSLLRGSIKSYSVVHRVWNIYEQRREVSQSRVFPKRESLLLRHRRSSSSSRMLLDWMLISLVDRWCHLARTTRNKCTLVFHVRRKFPPLHLVPLHVHHHNRSFELTETCSSSRGLNRCLLWLHHQRNISPIMRVSESASSLSR